MHRRGSSNKVLIVTLATLNPEDNAYMKCEVELDLPSYRHMSARAESWDRSMISMWLPGLRCAFQLVTTGTLTDGSFRPGYAAYSIEVNDIKNR